MIKQESIRRRRERVDLKGFRIYAFHFYPFGDKHRVVGLQFNFNRLVIEDIKDALFKIRQRGTRERLLNREISVPVNPGGWLPDKKLWFNIELPDSNTAAVARSIMSRS